MDLGGRFPPARSIPNLPNETCSMAPSAESYALARSSSQPAEIWGRNIIARSDHIRQFGDSAEYMSAATSKPIGVSTATQTENKIDLPAMEKFIVSNPRLVLNLLGIIEPSYQFECDLQPQILIPIPEADVSSPEAPSPAEIHAKRFSFDGGSSNLIKTTMSPSTTGVWNSPHNSNNKNAENSRSTDALLENSFDDCLLPSDESLSCIQPLSEIISFTMLRERGTRARNTTTSCSGSSDTNSLSSTTPKQSVSDSTTASAEAHQRLHRGVSLKRKKSWKDINTGRKSSIVTTAADCLNDSGNGAVIYPEDDNTNFDELNEKCALLCKEVRKNGNGRPSTSSSDIQKRNHLMPRPPYNYRFSAGDADKVEKGMENIPSTRSLRDS